MSHRPGALANGAKLFVNYCLNCHGASYMRYNRLQQIGLSEQMIKDNLMFHRRQDRRADAHRDAA